MSVFIISTFHRGKKLPVLLKKVNDQFQIVDIGGYDPKSFPKNVGISAVKKVTPRGLEIPVLSKDFDLGDFSL